MDRHTVQKSKLNNNNTLGITSNHHHPQSNTTTGINTHTNNSTSSGAASSLNLPDTIPHHSLYSSYPYPPTSTRDQTFTSVPTSHSRLSSKPAASSSARQPSSACPPNSSPFPTSSRDSSPNKPKFRSPFTPTPSRPPARTSGPPSRRNSFQDVSPTRIFRPELQLSQASSTPPASILPSSYSSASDLTPSANPPQSSTDTTILKKPVPLNPPATATSTGPFVTDQLPKWPVSPRLRSPPPVLPRPNLASGRRGEADLSGAAAYRMPQLSQPAFHLDLPIEMDLDDSSLQSGMRTPIRGCGATGPTLATVQEVSPLNSPDATVDEVLEQSEKSSLSGVSLHGETTTEHPLSRAFFSRTSLAPNESESESGSYKADRRSNSITAPSHPGTRQSSLIIKPAGVKCKTGEGSLQNMTVETETVASIPQVALALGGGVTGSSNISLRTRPSCETIRPRKEKKKPTRKQPPSGTASSKADIFEAKVASAVEEYDSSDSDETFVYDSNPPDGRDHHQRFHSRTPSATSMVSNLDRAGLRSLHGVPETSAPSRKNMKFVNSANAGSNDTQLDEEEGKIARRSNPGSGRSTARNYHNFHRWGRTSGNGHPSILTDESPFPNAAKPSKFTSNVSRQASNPPSPRFMPAANRSYLSSKRGMQMAYIDDTTPGADDELTPLLRSSTPQSFRSPGNRGRRPISLRSLEHQDYLRSPPSALNRFASCLVLTVMLLLVLSGAIGFMFATSQPLTRIELVDVTNVVASEQELMFDIVVRAHNPNVVVVVVDSADVEIFAKSPHAGTDSKWWRRPSGTLDNASHEASSAGFPDDLFGDPRDDSAPNMRLGTVQAIDSPLSFEGSFFHHGVSVSSGGIKLNNPGNGTTHGTERWERILDDEFDLILKGVLKYSLPLSQRVRSVALSGRTTVNPNSVNYAS